MAFSPIEEILAEVRAGRPVIVVDDPHRENEGDLALAAETITPEAINFMARHGRGLICLSMAPRLIDRLELPMMPRHPRNPADTAFTVSIEARSGVSTGISADDRAHTIRTAIADTTGPDDIVYPGHVFPLRANPHGVFARRGQTEGSVDLARLAGFKPASVICEVMNEDGSMARVPELREFCARHDLKMCTITQIVQYRVKTEKILKRVSSAQVPTPYGDFDLHLYRSIIDGSSHLALCKEIPSGTNGRPPLVRVHSECLTGDVFGSLRCDCGDQLHQALTRIEQEGCGILIYMPQEGRGIGLENKIRAYHLQDQGMDTVEANEALGFHPDPREYWIAAQVLSDLEIDRLRLMTNNPNKFSSLASYGLDIVERIPLEVEPSKDNHKYLKAKKEKLGHLLRGF